MRLRTVLAELGVRDAVVAESALEEDVIAGDLGPGATPGVTVAALVGADRFLAQGGSVPEGFVVLVHCGDEVPAGLARPQKGVVAFADPRPHAELERLFSRLPGRIALLDARRERLFRAFRGSYDLRQFAQRAHDVIGNPLMIVNSDRRLLATAGEFPADRRDVLDELTQGYISEEVDRQLQADGIIDDVRRAHHAIISDNPRFGQRWVTAIVSYHHLEMGRLDVLETDRAIDDLDLEVIDFACSLAGIMIDRLGLAGERADAGSSVLADMLSNTFHNEKTMRAQLSLTDLPLDDAYILLAVQGNAMSGPDYHRRVGRLVSRALGRCLWTSHGECVCVLLPIGRSEVSGFDGYERTEHLLGINGEFLAALDHNALVCCVSEPFQQLGFVSSRLGQCLSLLECGAGERLRYFWRLRYEALAANAPSFAQVDMMLDKRVVAMQQYDDDHGTQYLDTAVMSVRHPGSPAEVASILNVHRNTYFYRVNKIRELFFLDLKTGEDRLAVAFSARIMGGMGERLHVATDEARKKN